MVVGLLALKIVANYLVSDLVLLLSWGIWILELKNCLVDFLLAASLPTVVATLMMATSFLLTLCLEASSMYSWLTAPVMETSLYSLYIL